MTKLHEILAAEKTVEQQLNALLAGTESKFKKPGEYFEGRLKTLKMINEDPTNSTVEGQAREEKMLITNVHATLDHLLGFWANFENMMCRKHTTEMESKANIEFQGAVLLPDVPIDEILGLEKRLVVLRGLLKEMPSLNSARKWVAGDVEHTWRMANPEITSKLSAPIKYGIVLSPATEKHPAQVQVAERQDIVGKFTTEIFSGAVTAQQKADVLELIDQLLSEVKKAKSRCNEIEVKKVSPIGSVLKDLIMKTLVQNENIPNDR